MLEENVALIKKTFRENQPTNRSLRPFRHSSIILYYDKLCKYLLCFFISNSSIHKNFTTIVFKETNYLKTQTKVSNVTQFYGSQENLRSLETNTMN